MVFAGILYNLSLVVSIAVLAGFIQQNEKKPWRYLVSQGLIFGMASVLGMLYPLVFSPGLIFDGRSVMISVAGLFFGPVAAGIAAVMAIACRIFQGGVGAFTGIGVILASAFIGASCYIIRLRWNIKITYLKLWVFGLLVAAAMLLMMFTLPSHMVGDVLMKIALPVLLAYPLATILVGKILLDIFKDKQAREALRRSELDLKEAQQIAHLGRWELELPGKNLKWSDTIFDIFEIDRSKWGASYETFLDTVHPDDRERVHEAYMASLKDKMPYNVEHRLLMKDGRIKWVHEACRTDYDADGQPVRSVGIIQDITERKMAEERFVKSDSQFRNLFENSLNAVAIHEVIFDGRGIPVDYVFLSANTAFEKHTGLRVADIIGKRVTQVLPDIVKTNFIQIYGEVVVTGTPVSFEAFDGPLNRHFSITAYKVDAGCFAVVFEDISARKRSEEALRESERKLKEAQSMAKMGYWQWDVKTGNVKWSEEVFKIFGLDPLKFTPHIDSILALSPWPGDHERDKELIQHAIRDHSVGEYEQRFMRPDGSVGCYCSTFQGEYDERGHLVGMVGTVLDITERKKAENEIKQLNQELERRVRQRTVELERANKELEAFSYSVSHDLRAPLRSIEGFSQILMEDLMDKLDTRSKDYLQRVCGAVAAMGKIIDDMLDLSRVGRQEMKITAVDLSAMARRVCAEFRDSAPGRIVEFKVQDNVVVQGDEGLLQIVMQNLLGNAWKFTSKHAWAVIEFGARDVEGKPVCFVRDDGAGIDMAYADKLFGVFQRLHAKDEFPGTGIGLSIVHRIIARHGGRVWIESAGKEKGVTVNFLTA